MSSCRLHPQVIYPQTHMNCPAAAVGHMVCITNRLLVDRLAISTPVIHHVPLDREAFNTWWLYN